MSKTSEAKLVDDILYTLQRLIDEQDNALDLLDPCRRHHYLHSSDIEKERRRLSGNIDVSRQKIRVYRQHLVELASEHPARKGKE